MHAILLCHSNTNRSTMTLYKILYECYEGMSKCSTVKINAVRNQAGVEREYADLPLIQAED